MKKEEKNLGTLEWRGGEMAEEKQEERGSEGTRKTRRRKWKAG